MQTIYLPQDQKIETDVGLVIVGANGSGKTRFGSWIDISASQKTIPHRISAQKSLNMPDNVRSMDVSRSMASLICGHEGALYEQYNQFKPAHKWQNSPETMLINDYEKLLVYLFSEHNEISNQYLEDSTKSKIRIEPPIFKIIMVQKIWEEILPHRQLIIKSCNIQTCSMTNQPIYSASKMSDGERVAFYLIGQCLSAPKNGILIIDEPELHLHKSIQYALWDRIEKVRKDCLFVYLTHDVEFAASRTGFKKIWLTDYDGTKWSWKELDDEMDLPEELLLEVYGSRKKVLLVEGSNSSHDVRFYKNIFKDFLVKPCGSCEKVITYTKSLRSNQCFHQLDVYGLVDRDRRTEEEIKSLEENGIFTLAVAEVENLFATPEILKIVADRLALNYDEKINTVKNFVIGELKKELNPQILERTTEELKRRLNKSDLSSKTQEELNHKYLQLTTEINFNAVYDEIKKTFNQIILNNDYEKLLSFYNRKNIASRIGAVFGLKEKELPYFITRLSKDDKCLQDLISAVYKYLPVSLIALVNNNRPSIARKLSETEFS